MLLKDRVKGILEDDYDLVESIIYELGFCNLKEYGGYWRFGYDETSNPSALRLYKGSLNFKNYKYSDKSGDIYSLVQYKRGCNFEKALEYLAHKCGLVVSEEELNKKVNLPFGSFFKNIKKIKLDEYIETYSEEILDNYKKTYFELLINDGIGFEAQEFFNVRYDLSSGRIAFPVYRKEGLVGVLGRLNLKNVEDGIAKYLPLVAYPKSKVVFGLVENKKYIKDKRVYVVESEKSVMRAFSMGYRNVVALGGNSISDMQKVLIHSALPKEIIIALDEGLELTHIIHQAEFMKTMNVLFKKAKIGYINPYDLDRKSCIFDMSDEICEKKMKEVNWIGI